MVIFQAIEGFLRLLLPNLIPSVSLAPSAIHQSHRPSPFIHYLTHTYIDAYTLVAGLDRALENAASPGGRQRVPVAGLLPASHLSKVWRTRP